MDLIRAWGFTHKTGGFYWVKLNPSAKSNDAFFIGLGYWTRANPNNACSPHAEARAAAPKTSHTLSSNPAASTAENRTPSEPASSACSTAPISNCSPAQPSQAGMPEAPEIGLFDNGHAPTTVNPRKPRRAHAA